MDKFTVDLDQVLNDFEYSELTDQYNNSAKLPDNSPSVVQTHNVSKHSINNVFHSLNEYLNTNINVNNVEAVDNNVNESVGDYLSSTIKEESINEDFKAESDILHLNVTQGKVKEGNDLCLIGNTEELNVEAISNIDILPDNIHNDILKIPECFNNDSTVEILDLRLDNENTLKHKSSENNVDLHTELQNVVGSDFGIKYEKNGGNLPIDGPELKTVIGFEQALHLDDQEINKLLSELEEDDEINVEANESQLSINNVGCEIVDNENFSYNEGELGDVTTEIKNFNDINEDKLENLGNSATDYNLVENAFNADNILNESGKSHVEEVINNSEDDFKHLYSLENCKKLEELTLECPKENVNNADYIETELLNSNFMDSQTFSNTNNVIDIENIPSFTTQNSVTQLNDLPNLTNNDSSEEAGNAEINCSVETNQPSVEIPTISETPIPSMEEENSILQSDILDITSEEANLKIVAVNSECLIQEVETVVPQTSKDLVEDVKMSSQKDELMESKSRPNDLPLGNEMMDSERKINLIGDPGSTPYNNIYVNNEIEKQKHNDNLNCSSTSTSPTFSDASSTASTASTEDIQFKQDTNDTSERNNENEPENSLHETVTITEAVGTDIPEEGNNLVEENIDVTEISQEIADTVLDPSSRVTVGEEPSVSTERCWLGKEAPLWIPDSEAISCLHCDMKFTMLKRRHHCRACGLVLCSKCCHLRFRLEYLDAEARVCNRCHDILNKESSGSSSSDISPEGGSSPSHRPNPNNPLEYCSTISPLQQVSSGHHSPPAVMVPVGVLKRKGSNKAKSSKSVMFCDGIRPGSDLTNLDNDFNYNNTFTKKLEKNNASAGKINRNLPLIDSETNTFIPKNENSLPPTVCVNKSDIKYTECSNNLSTVNILKETQLTFAIHISLHVHVKVINMDCCVNKVAWCFSTEGLINVGQDEIVILLEYLDEESVVPKDIFYHINTVYNDAVKGNSIKEMGLSLQNSHNFLDSKNHAGFIYIRPTFQCLENVIKPKDPFLIGILIHRWETPWAKLFPLRLILRLGAEYRYYPSPIISTRHRDSVYVEIGHTIINILADFRNFSYSLPQIRGLTIHMEEKITTVNIPVNRYDQVLKSLNNSSDHILAFAGNFSVEADSHLVCIQDTQGNENCYSTHAINIHNKPRKITGASFIVFNGALKTSSGLTAKSNIIEDGLMIQVLPEQLKQIRESLRAMKNYTISCGCVDDVSDETVQIVWSENDTNFNVGVLSTIDSMPLSGIPSIRVHNGKNYVCHNGSRIIRWTEVFIIQNGEDNPKGQDPVDISRVSESIAKATCDALVRYLDLLIANNFQKIGIRVNLHVDNVSYCAGSNTTKLPPIYMKSLDNELIPVLHRITSNNFGENTIILELIFRILNV